MNKTHAFDSRQTVITVGPAKLRYPFTTEEYIFALSDLNRNSFRAQGIKLKPSLVTQEHCGVCRKPKAEFKGKKIAQCDFCATFGCVECISKTFPFPQLDPHDKQQNFGTVCMTCETKLHINTVTSDILRAL